nr:oligosaccharide flippase family protein [uncultured Rhodopila sp.]
MSIDAPAAQGSLTGKAIIGAAWLLAWRVVTRSLGLVSTLVMARLLLPSDFGLVAMATAFSYGVEALSQLGLQEALVRRREDGFGLHHTAFTLQVGRALATAIVIAAGAPVAAAWFSEPRLVTVLFVLAGITVLNGLENVGIADYRRAMRFDVQFKLLSVPRLAGFAAMIGYALVWGSYRALLAGMLVSSVVRVAMSYRLHPFRPRLRLSRWREVARFSFWTWATSAVSLVWDRCDPFVLGPGFGSAKLGLYLLAMEIALLPVTEIVAPAADALFAAFSSAQKDGDSSVHHAPEVAGIILLGVAPIVLTVSAASGPIVEVMLGTKWVDAWPIVSVLSWACVFSPFSFICSMALVANGHVERNFVANVIMSTVKLTVLLVVVSLTVDGVVIGAVTAGCVAIESVIFLTLLHGIGGVRIRPALGGLLRVVLATGLAAGAVAWSRLGWQEGAGSVGINLMRGAAIAAESVGVFGLGVLLLWQAAGRPPGAETRLAGLAASRLAGSRVLRFFRSAVTF